MGRSSGLDDVEREAALKLHAGCAENGAQRACGSTLLADHFTDVAGSDMETEHGGFLFGQYLYADSFGVIHQRSGNFGQKELHFGHSKATVQRV